MKAFYDSPIGILKIEEKDGYIVKIELSSEFCKSDSCEVLDKTKLELSEYFSGKRKIFDIPLNPHGTDFQKRVWEALTSIEYGKTANYEEIARAIGKPKACRAVGNANNKNPILILQPCHRVISKNGQIGGFAIGIEKKKYLLQLEK